MKIEQASCDETKDKIGEIIKGKTVSECEQACITEKACGGYAYGRDEDTTYKGNCILYTKFCSIKNEENLFYDYYSPRNIEQPSKEYDKCTHRLIRSDRKGIIEFCKTLDAGKCGTNYVDCKFISSYTKIENTDCSETNLQVGADLPGKNYLTCETACNAEPLCRAFSIKRLENSPTGPCKLFKPGCSLIEAEHTFDFYVQQTNGRESYLVWVIAPTKTKSKCTHQNHHSLTKAKIDECKGLSSNERKCQEYMTDLKCTWTHYGIKHEKGGCTESNMIGSVFVDVFISYPNHYIKGHDNKQLTNVTPE